MIKTAQKKILTDLQSAIMFITILPASKNIPFSPLTMVRFFPVVGLILGVLLICVDKTASIFWAVPVTSLIDVITLIVLTGAFHLDGLGDAADGLFSHRSKERALEIMKDSRTGMMGLIAVFSSLALKIAGIYSVKSICTEFETILILLIIPSYARASMLFGIRYFKYGREKGGTGYELFTEKLPLSDFMFVLIPISLSLLLGIKGLIINSVFALSLFLIILFYKKKMGCITGDMLGAMCEVTESFLFLAAGITI